MKPNEHQLKRYLLGDLDDSSAEAVDIWIIEDPRSTDALLMAEHGLIEEYLEMSLSAHDDMLFRSNFLTSTERQLRIEEISMLKRLAADTEGVGALKSESASTPGLLARLLNLPRPLLAACAALVVAVVAFCVWINLSPAQTPLEIEYAALNQQDLSLNATHYSQIQLASGTMRDTGVASGVASVGLTDAVMFRLALPYKPSAEYLPRVELRGDGGSVFRVESPRVYATDVGSEVRILIPKSLLTGGRLQLMLSDNGKADTSLAYNFVVE